MYTSPKPSTRSRGKPTAAQRSAQIADASTHRVEMVPLPLRVAVLQHSRLGNARDRTGISIQEHVRRAIDLYLAVLEREAIELGLVPNEFTPPQQQGKAA